MRATTRRAVAAISPLLPPRHFDLADSGAAVATFDFAARARLLRSHYRLSLMFSALLPVTPIQRRHRHAMPPFQPL